MSTYILEETSKGIQPVAIEDHMTTTEKYS